MKDTTNIPTEIQSLLEWFGKIISHPLNEQNQINQASSHGISIINDAATFISSGTKLKPYQCIEIYNKQFWLRLINILQKNFPLVYHLLGPKFFQKISTKFLQSNFPDHWSLTFLGEKFPDWLSNYFFEDNELIQLAAELDWTFYSCFISKRINNLNLDSFSKIFNLSGLDIKLSLQPCASIVKYPYDLPYFREKIILQTPNLYNSIPILKKNGTSYFIIFRNCNGKISWKGLKKFEFLMLEQFKYGISLKNVCAWILQQDEESQKIISLNFQHWIRNWISLGWLFLV